MKMIRSSNHWQQRYKRSISTHGDNLLEDFLKSIYCIILKDKTLKISGISKTDKKYPKMSHLVDIG